MSHSDSICWTWSWFLSVRFDFCKSIKLSCSISFCIISVRPNSKNIWRYPIKTTLSPQVKWLVSIIILKISFLQFHLCVLRGRIFHWLVLTWRNRKRWTYFFKNWRLRSKICLKILFSCLRKRYRDVFVNMLLKLFHKIHRLVAAISTRFGFEIIFAEIYI